MSKAITAVYEQGVLRPLKPLNVPEHSRLEIQIVGPATENQTEAERARQVLHDAGLIQLGSRRARESVSEEELTDAGRRGRPL